MKTLVLVLLFFVGNSCDPVAKETPDESNDNPVKVAENDDSNSAPPVQESMNPGEISLKVKIMEVYDSSKDICGISKTNVMKIGVEAVIGRGSSIVNLPNKNDTVLMTFMLAPKDLVANSLIEVKAKETLCRDTSKTYFTIISHKIVE